MDPESKIYVAGHRGLAGSAIMRELQTQGYSNFVVRTSSELDLRNQQAVNQFFEDEKPDYVFLAAAKVGGILANSTYPAEFIYDNIMIQTNVIHAAYMNRVKKLLFLGSSCVYPKFPELPITEDQLLTGELETTNEAYAIAKISGLKMVEFYNTQFGTDFISLMPTNLYGPNDNYHPQNSHVLAALVRKFVEATMAERQEVVIWGTGEPKREFLYIDDFANAAVFLMDNYSGSEMVNVGTGKEISINDLAELLKELTGFEGNIVHDRSKPDGTYSKVMDISKLKNLGWSPDITLRAGLTQIIADFRNNYNQYTAIDV